MEDYRVMKLLRQAFAKWMKDNALRMGAALSFYTVFSLAPLLIIVIAVSGIVFGQSVAQEQILNQIAQLIGAEGAQAVQALLVAARQQSSSHLPTVVSIMTLLVGATGALVELQDGLNRVWDVPEVTGRFMVIVLQRLISFALILCIAFLLLVSLVVSAMLSMVGTFLSGRLPGSSFFWQSADFILSWAVITMLFAIIYKILPDTSVHWRDVWMGSAVASVLFTLGKFFVGLYIGRSALASTYGAAGSFVVVLVWVYYSALLLYYGAEFTKVYAHRIGSQARPSSASPTRVVTRS